MYPLNTYHFSFTKVAESYGNDKQKIRIGKYQAASEYLSKIIDAVNSIPPNEQNKFPHDAIAFRHLHALYMAQLCINNNTRSDFNQVYIGHNQPIEGVLSEGIDNAELLEKICYHENRPLGNTKASLINPYDPVYSTTAAKIKVCLEDAKYMTKDRFIENLIVLIQEFENCAIEVQSSGSAKGCNLF
jgi:hypothetical protein